MVIIGDSKSLLVLTRDKRKIFGWVYYNVQNIQIEKQR